MPPHYFIQPFAAAGDQPLEPGRVPIAQAGTVTLRDGARLLAYTDGAIEARNVADEEFGLGRLIEVCSANLQQDADDFLSRVLQDVITWSSGTEQADDVTLVALAG